MRRGADTRIGLEDALLPDGTPAGNAALVRAAIAARLAGGLGDAAGRALLT